MPLEPRRVQADGRASLNASGNAEISGRRQGEELKKDGSMPLETLRFQADGRANLNASGTAESSGRRQRELKKLKQSRECLWNREEFRQTAEKISMPLEPRGVQADGREN